MESVQNDPLVNHLVEIARMAAFGVLKYYELTDETTTMESRVQLAKSTSLNVIVKGIRAHYPDIPIIYEGFLKDNTDNISSLSDGTLSSCFCVNPLDGEMDFVRGLSSGFAISIGFCIAGNPLIGVICCPAAAFPPPIYYGVSGKGAFKELEPQTPIPFQVAVVPPSSPRIISSQLSKHAEKETSLSADKLLVRQRPPAAICLRFLAIADGSSHIFPYFSPSSEWETCAGHAILLAAGGSVEPDVQSSERSNNKGSSPVRYGKSTSINSPFIAYGKRPASNHQSTADGEKFLLSEIKKRERRGAKASTIETETENTDSDKDQDQSLAPVVDAKTNTVTPTSGINVVLLFCIAMAPVFAAISFAYYHM